MHDLIVGWSDDQSISDAEIAAGATSSGNSVTIPTGTADHQYLFIWRADADGGDPTEVHVAGSGDSRSTFGAAVARTVDGTQGQLIVSAATYITSYAEGENVRVV